MRVPDSTICRPDWLFPASRGVRIGRDFRHTDNAGLPANPRADDQGPTIFLKFHNLGEVGAECLPCQSACLCQDFVQVVGPESEFPKPRQGGLVP